MVFGEKESSFLLEKVERVEQVLFGVLQGQEFGADGLLLLGMALHYFEEFFLLALGAAAVLDHFYLDFCEYFMQLLVFA